MSQGKKFPDQFWNTVFIESLKNNFGIIAHACTKSGTTPQCYYAHRLAKPAFAKKVDNIKSKMCLPMCEDVAMSAAYKGSERLLIFMLRNLGKGKWSQDKIEEAMAKTQPEISKQKELEKLDDMQRLPTKAEKAAAKAYLENLEDDEE